MFIIVFVNVENMYVECLNIIWFICVNVISIIVYIIEYEIMGFLEIFMFFVMMVICLLNFRM